MTADDHAVVEAVLARAERLETPCGDGAMVWRKWGSDAGGRPPIVLLHGGYGSWVHWIRNIDDLAGRSTVYVADLPGMGDSALPREPIDGWSIAEVVAAGLDALIPAPTRVDVIGFSFGGVVGAPITRLRPDRVRSLAIVGAGGHGPVRRPIELLPSRHVTDLAERRDIHRANLGRLMIADPTRIDDLAVSLQLANVERGRLPTRPISRTAVLDEALTDFPLPLTAIFGALDATSYPSLKDRIERLRAKVPHVDVTIIPDAGHWVAYEAPEAFDAAVLAMLARLDQVSGSTVAT